jgi:glycosyltransferase EpsF
MGDLKKVVEAQVEEYGIQENVLFAGFQTEIPKFLSAFDVFLLPSIHEGLPVVAAEAQALG